MSADAVIPGFRIIRKLGEGPRAQVFLARTERDSPSEHSRVDAASTSKTVALKLYRAGVRQHDWITEVEALERSAGAHVVALTDIAATAADRVALVLDRL
ncbi:MAG: hypothetical protein LH471_05595, partial [Salinibacterium sp.]|nr:hypothetical protein [Salinibacterium sp.]